MIETIHELTIRSGAPRLDLDLLIPMTRRNLWKEQDEEARIWREELGWVGKIAYILLAVILPIAAAILTPWLAEQIAAR
jgi:hypothetical protein